MIRESSAAASAPRVLGRLSEHYKVLADRLRRLPARSGETVQVAGITSCSSGEGVTTVVTNLAATAAALYDRPVLIVDANFARPALHHTFRVAVGPGLADALVGTIDAATLIHDTSEANLSLLPAGSAAACTRAAYDPAKVAALLATLKDRFGLILFDLPAFTASSSSSGLVGSLDGVLLVVESERVALPEAQRVKRQLVEIGAHPLGVVLNKHRAHVPGWLANRL